MQKRIVSVIAITLLVGVMALGGLTRSISAQTSTLVPTNAAAANKVTCPDTTKPIITPTATQTVETPSASPTPANDPVPLASSNLANVSVNGPFNVLHTVLDFNSGVTSVPYFFKGQVNLIVIQGNVTYCSGSLQHVLVPGDSWTVPANALFTLANGGTDMARLSLVALEPLATATVTGTAETTQTAVATGTAMTPTLLPSASMPPSGTPAANAVAYLGIRGTAVDNTGIKVLELLTNSPAGAAGVLVNDIIMAVDGQPVSGLLPASAATATVAPDQVAPLVTAFFQLIAQHHPGDTIQLTLQRGSQTMTVAVTLGSTTG